VRFGNSADNWRTDAILRILNIEQVGLEGLGPETVLWRFYNRKWATALFEAGEIRLSRVSDLRKKDRRESHLPALFTSAIRRTSLPPAAKEFLNYMAKAIEDQAFGVFASCWFLPGTSADEERMWNEYGGGSEGGIKIISTLDRLMSSLPNDDRRTFGVGRIQYVLPNSSILDTWNLNEYRSSPFLLKLKKYHQDREVRLYERHHVPPWEENKDSEPKICRRFRFGGGDLVQSVSISPLCTAVVRKSIREDLLRLNVPRSFLERA
jgi:hypothetical protein